MSCGPPAVRMRTMSKSAKVTIRLNSTVIEMMFRIIGKVTKISFCMALAPSMAAASYNCSGTDFSAARYMIMKNGVPYQTLTAIVQNLAIQPTPSQGTFPTPNWFSTQLNAEYDGSNIHHQVSVERANGITHGTSKRPRQMRWFLPGMLCIRCARMKPIMAFRATAVMANRQLWKITSWKV